ncbi:RNA polymerase II mediator complex subunit [Sporothrix bragantina]|uniref:Mediator of RNA polymerase II transcription subunit 17 n=1 Tax=Sporothrix bragantina TaxID=671064 RepID=A0ABP0BHJ8_9PEZI
MADNRARPAARPGVGAGTGAAAGAGTAAPNRAAGLGPPPPPPGSQQQPQQQSQVTPLGPPPPPRQLFGKRDAVFRPWPLPSKQPANIGEFVQRLKFQGIDFRDLNEDTLREQIEKEKAEEAKGEQKKKESTKTVASTDVKRNTSHDRPRGLQEMIAKRDEILMSLEAAVQSGLIAVDFVSLLLSKDRPTQALQTLSPIVRDKAGIGTLSAGRIANAAQAARAIQSQSGGGFSAGGNTGGLSAAEVQALDETTRFNAQRLVEHKLECVGWQLLAMDRASEVLQVGRKRLRAEMRREERYWAEVLAVRDKGWTLSRMPGQRRVLRVKFGFAESAPDLRALSFAPLQRVKNGQVALDLSALGAPSAIVLTLKKTVAGGKEVIGRSPLATRLPDSASLEARLLEARNTVHAKELWRELGREARTMIAHGVAFYDDAIVFPAGAGIEGIITIEPLYHRPSANVSAAEKAKRDADATHDPQLNDMATGLATSLQLFLAHGHRDHYRQRSSPPPPSDSTPPPPIYYMLRPIVANLKYEKGIEHIAGYLSDVCGILHGVGLEGSCFTLYERPLSMSIPPTSTAKPQNQQNQQQHAPSASEGLCNAFLAPREFSFEYTINDQVRILVRCRTTVAPLKAQYLVQLLPPASSSSPSSSVPTPLAPPGPPPPKNPLVDVFPPADNYGTLRDVLDYLSKATSHVLAAHARKLACQWEDRSGMGAVWSTSVDGMEILQKKNAFARVRFSLVPHTTMTALDTLVALTEGRDPVVPIENDKDNFIDGSEELADAQSSEAGDAENNAQDTENARNVDSPMVHPSPPELRVYASWSMDDTETAVYRKWVWSASSLAEKSIDDANDANDLESVVIGCVSGKLKPPAESNSR